MADLDIYVDDRKVFRSGSYLLLLVVERLERAGLTVRVLETLDGRPDAPVAFVHVDRTDLPAPFIWVDRLYPRTINGRAVSVARDRYSTARVFRDDPHTGPVIIKTRLNHRGLPEYYDLVGQHSFMSRFRRRVFGHDPHRELRERLCPEYRVLEHLDQVPDDVWQNPHLIVERFAARHIDGPIVKHRHEFFFDVGLTTKMTFADPLGDTDTLIELEFVDEVPETVTEVAGRLGLDYGSVDYFLDDGVATVIDVNKTTSLTRHWVERHDEIGLYLDAVADRLREMTT